MFRPVVHSSALPAFWLGPPPAAAWRRRQVHRLAHALWAVSAWMRRLARRLAPRQPAPRALGLHSLPELEFHADSGAPEGALYVNGDYVGRLRVSRL